MLDDLGVTQANPHHLTAETKRNSPDDSFAQALTKEQSKSHDHVIPGRLVVIFDKVSAISSKNGSSPQRKYKNRKEK
jgi:hypothetical protein